MRPSSSRSKRSAADVRLRSVAVYVCAVSGCRFGFEPIPADADATTCSCTTFSPSDSFDGGPACGPWGSSTTNGLDMTRTSGALAITPRATPATATDFGGCTLSNYDMRAHDAFVEVTSVLDGDDAYTNIAYYYESSSTGVAVASNGMMHVIVADGSVRQRRYDPVAMRFWRIHVDGTRLRLQVAPDACAWVDLETRDVTDATLLGNLAFGAGRIGAAAAGTAQFASFNLCP
jgi:hypothetical protein